MGTITSDRVTLRTPPNSWRKTNWISTKSMLLQKRWGYFSNAIFFEKVRLCVLNICRFCWKLISTMTRSYLWMNFKLWWPRVQISCRLFTSQYKPQLPIWYAWKLYPPKKFRRVPLESWSDHFWFGMIMIQPYIFKRVSCHVWRINSKILLNVRNFVSSAINDSTMY